VRIEKLKDNFDIRTEWIDFPLHPETPEEGRFLEELFQASPQEMAVKRARLKQAANDFGLPLGDRQKTFNSRRAQELGKWAEARQRGDQYRQAVFNAYFVEGRNIAEISVLTDIAASIGLPGQEAKQIVETGTFKSAVDADWARSYTMGITAVPTLVINGRTLVGAQPYAAMEQLLIENGVSLLSPMPTLANPD